MRIESIQVGQPAKLASDWTSAIFKSPVQGPVYLSKLNLAGDRQADLKVHGGPDKAVNVYPKEHYRYWSQRVRFLLRKRIRLPRNPNGSFGENFTVSSLTEKDVFIGDTFEIGNAIVQISQPRQPCWKLARKFKQPKLPFWVQESGKTGWYFRVLQEGEVEAGNLIELLDRPCSNWSVEKANHLMHSPQRSLTQVADILECSYLSASWRDSFEKMIDGLNNEDLQKS